METSVLAGHCLGLRLAHPELAPWDRYYLMAALCQGVGHHPQEAGHPQYHQRFRHGAERHWKWGVGKRTTYY